MDTERQATNAKALLSNYFFVETMQDLRERQKDVFAGTAAHEIERREEAHAILRALNQIEYSLQSYVDAATLIKGKGQHRGND